MSKPIAEEIALPGETIPEHAYLLTSVKPTEQDIKWAKEKIKSKIANKKRLDK